MLSDALYNFHHELFGVVWWISLYHNKFVVIVVFFHNGEHPAPSELFYNVYFDSFGTRVDDESSQCLLIHLNKTLIVRTFYVWPFDVQLWHLRICLFKIGLRYLRLEWMFLRSLRSANKKTLLILQISICKSVILIKFSLFHDHFSITNNGKPLSFPLTVTLVGVSQTNEYSEMSLRWRERGSV